MTNVIEIKAGDMLMDENGEAVEILAIKGRWVKLEDGRNISRGDAAEWRQVYLDEIGEEEEDEEGEGKMSGTLKKYRPTYQKSTSYNGNASLDNGDEVAALLRGLSPDETCSIADALFEAGPGHHWERWQHLNAGSRRMNAGNRIRAAVRRGDKTVEELAALVDGQDLIEEE